MAEELNCSGSEFYGLSRELLDSGLSFHCQVRGRSMVPFLRDGDVLQVAPGEIKHLRVGDIIFYRSGDRLLAHRVIGFVATPAGRCARARGDAFVQEDPPIAEEDLIGRVEAVSRPRRDGWREIPLDRGWRRSGGILVARSKVAHRCVRWLSRGWLRLAGARRRLPRASEDHQRGTVADVEKQKS